jgi:hypothetical protein
MMVLDLVVRWQLTFVGPYTGIDAAGGDWFADFLFFSGLSFRAPRILRATP